MTSAFKTPYRTLGASLRHVVEENLTTVKQLCEVGQCSDQTIRNYMSETVRVDGDVFHRLIIAHPSTQVRRILAEAALSGGEFQITSDAGETDIDRDGRTTAHDALLSLSQVSKRAADQLEQLLADSADGLNDQEIQRASDGLLKLKHEVLRTIAALEKAAGQQRLRMA